MMKQGTQRMKMQLLVLACAVLAIAGHAQPKSPVRMGIAINMGGTLKAPERLGAGLDLRLQKSLGSGISGIATTGYYRFFKPDKGSRDIGLVPLKAGLKYFPARNVYAAAEVGVGIATQHGQETSFVFSPSVGLAFAQGFDISMKYENFTTYNGYLQQLALRLAYGFKL